MYRTGDGLGVGRSTGIPSKLASIMSYAVKHASQEQMSNSDQGPPMDSIHGYLEHCDDVIEDYKGLAKHSAIGTSHTRIRKTIGTTWASDKKGLDELNEKAMLAAGNLASGHILPNPKASMMRPSAEADDTEKMAWDIFANHRLSKKEETWGRMAQVQCMTFAKLLMSSRKV